MSTLKKLDRLVRKHWARIRFGYWMLEKVDNEYNRTEYIVHFLDMGDEAFEILGQFRGKPITMGKGVQNDLNEWNEKMK